MSQLIYEYRDLVVASRMKPMGTLQADLIHMTLEQAGEAGELVDAIKKHWVYGKPLDVGTVVEELGDLLFYIQGVLNIVTSQGVLAPETLKNFMVANMNKLSKRYPTGYSDQAAIVKCADKD